MTTPTRTTTRTRTTTTTTRRVERAGGRDGRQRPASPPRRGASRGPADPRELIVGVQRRGTRLPAVAAGGAAGDRQRRRPARRGARRVRVGRSVHLGRRRRARGRQHPQVPQYRRGPDQGVAGGRRPGVDASRSSPGRCGFTGTPNRRSNGSAWSVPGSTAGSPRRVSWSWNLAGEPAGEQWYPAKRTVHKP